MLHRCRFIRERLQFRFVAAKIRIKNPSHYLNETDFKVVGQKIKPS